MKRFRVHVLISEIDRNGVEVLRTGDSWVCDEEDYETLAKDDNLNNYAMSTIANLVDA